MIITGRRLGRGRFVGTAAQRFRRWFDTTGKRALDLAIAALILLLVLPVFAILAAAIKLESRGPVFFRSRRVGFRGAELAMLKFRKMHHAATGSPLTLPDDYLFLEEIPRTSTGKFKKLELRARYGKHLR